MRVGVLLITHTHYTRCIHACTCTEPGKKGGRGAAAAGDDAKAVAALAAQATREHQLMLREKEKELERERQRAKELRNPSAVCLSVVVADCPSRASRPTLARQPAAKQIETYVESYPYASHRARPTRQTCRRAWTIAEALRFAPAMTKVVVSAPAMTSRAMCEAGA